MTAFFGNLPNAVALIEIQSSNSWLKIFPGFGNLMVTTITEIRGGKSGTADGGGSLLIALIGLAIPAVVNEVMTEYQPSSRV